jgi:hypothetical protein
LKRLTAVYLVLFAVQFLVAFICAPHSCEWGNAVYFYAGIFFLIVAFLLAFLQKKWTIGKRIALGILFLLISAVLWCAGFIIFNFSIICRLF